MDAKELRIGNLLQGRMVYHVVSEIKEAYYTHQFGSTLIKDAKPIPLTEEWLIKFGFELIEDAGDIKGYRLPGFSTFEVELNHQDIALNVCIDEYCKTVMYNEKFFSYVHQLQNLFFALTGTELTIK